MSFSKQSTSYREMEIYSASPERLVVIVFEQLVVNLERARIAMERDDLALQVLSLGRARVLLYELLNTLDEDRGDPLAVQLADLYQFMLVELVDVGPRGDITTLRKLIGMATSLRDGFVGAAAQVVVERRKSA
jgi:flagellar protein FliS